MAEPQQPAPELDVGVDSRDLARAELQNQICAEIKERIKPFGGPAQYLTQQLKDQRDLNEFGQWLWEYFPEADDTCYHHSHTIPPIKDLSEIAASTPTCVHVAALGFSSLCSLKPPPEFGLFNNLVEQYLLHGFMTSNEPLLIVQSSSQAVGLRCKVFWDSPNAEPLWPFALGYMKGMARSCALLALLHHCTRQKIDIKLASQQLYDSILRVYVHHVWQASKLDEAMANMRLSCAGSLRKAVNVIQMAVMIINLFRYGLSDFGIFIRKWNQQSAKQFQISGKRAMALRLLFESAPQATLS